MAQRRVGLWLIGAFGGVGSSVALGLASLARGLTDTTGLVTALPPFAKLDLDAPANFVVAGHETRSGDFAEACAHVGGGDPAFPMLLIDNCRDDLDAWSADVRQAPLDDEPKAFIERVQTDLRGFQKERSLDQIVVVNVASTEPPAELHPGQLELAELNGAIARGDMGALPRSGWYAYAALAAGIPYVNFTPSCGADVPALLALAEANGVPVAGSDGKTGETLLKTVLAPMFAARNLKVLSWVGHNILGNRDGQVLSDPNNRASKLRTKDRVVPDILGYHPQTLTSIEYVESLDDWKTAWDHVHFQGFLGVRMAMQFTWQGCDSALAAPLVIDLARLVLLAQRRGERGIMHHLAAFFKSPLGGGRHEFVQQTARLFAYAQAASN